MAIDWNRVITIFDEKTVNVTAGKEILYVRDSGGGGGGGGGDVYTAALADVYDPTQVYPFGAVVAKNGWLYKVYPGFEPIHYKILEASGLGFDGEYYYYDDPYDHNDGLYEFANMGSPSGLAWNASSAMAAFNQLSGNDHLLSVETTDYDPEATYETGDVVVFRNEYYKKTDATVNLVKITVEELVTSSSTGGGDAPQDGKGYIRKDGEWVEETIIDEISRYQTGVNYDQYRLLYYKDGDPTDQYALWFRIYPQLIDPGIEKTYEPCAIVRVEERPPSRALKKYYVVDSVDQTTPLKENDLVLQFSPQWDMYQGRKQFFKLNNYELICVPKYQSGNVNLLTPIIVHDLNGIFIVPQDNGSIRLWTPYGTSSTLLAATYPTYLRAGSYKLSGAVTSETIAHEEFLCVRIRATNAVGSLLAQDTGSGATFTLDKDTFVLVHIDLLNTNDSSFPEGEYAYPMLLPADATAENFVSPSGFCLKKDTNYTIWGGCVDFATDNRVREWTYVEDYNLDTAHDPEITGKWYSDRDDYVPGTLPQDGATVVYQMNVPTQNKLDDVPEILYPNNFIYIFSIDVQSDENYSFKNAVIAKRYGYQIPIKDYVDNRITDLSINTLAPQEMIADKYIPGYPFYEIGDIFIKDGTLCRLTLAPFPSGFETIETTEITAQGSASNGDYLTYDGTLYQFVSESAYPVQWYYPTAEDAVADLIDMGRIEDVSYTEFDPDETYAVGDIVVNEETFYKKTGDPEHYFEEVKVTDLYLEQEYVADVYNPNSTYAENDFVTKDNGLFRTTAKQPYFTQVPSVTLEGAAKAGDVVVLDGTLYTFKTPVSTDGILRWVANSVYDALYFIRSYIIQVDYITITAEGSAKAGAYAFYTYNGNPQYMYFLSDISWSYSSDAEAYTELLNTDQVLGQLESATTLGTSGTLLQGANRILIYNDGYNDIWYTADLKGNAYAWTFPTTTDAESFFESNLDEVSGVSEYDPTVTYEVGDFVEINGEPYKYVLDSGYDLIQTTVEEMTDYKIEQFDAPSDGHIYGRKNGAWVALD